MCVKENAQNQIIICSNNGGVSIIHPNKKVETFTKKHGLAEDFVFSAYPDKENILWLATRNGIIRYDGKNFVNYNNSTSGLPIESIFDILEDDKGYFWLSANSGLIRVSKQQLNEFAKGNNTKIYWKIFDKQDGMIASECTGAVMSMKAQDGKLWFPTLKGITIVNPANFSFNKTAPLVNIHRFWVNDKIVDISQKIDLSPQEYRLKIEYSALNFLNPNKIKFKIRLSGYEKEWIQFANERSATYTSLPHGKYTFQVIACNEDGICNEVGDSLSFSIQPYFYETWTFYIFSGIFSIVFVIGIIRWRTYQIHHQNKKLENLVKERTFEIEQQKSEIQAKNEILNKFNEKITATLRTVELQNAEIQNKNKNITDSINYAQRIQKAMLSTASFESLLGSKNFFILFKPRDIVSGDFYWIAQLKEKIIIAVADCTGHGVPGAFVSMVGNSFLNEIVLGEGFSVPQVILKRLHKKIIDFFHQQEESNELTISDGMDIAILTLHKDLQTQKILKAYYSGAMNPLYYIQNQTFFEIRGTKKSVGGGRMAEARAFEMHEIQLDTPTIFYLCTDGYQDQFGGEKRKKFMVKNLKDKLLSIHTKELQEQKNELDNTINNWMSIANEIQTDDITIVGIRT